MKRVTCSEAIIENTVARLRAGGLRREERVALWLARAGSKMPAEVIEVYEPNQIAEIDFFKLPRESMRDLLSHLGATRRRIVAQIHTHPGRAFHSDADAAWAIVRHVGALSLVLPTFASSTTLQNFLQQVKIYEFSPAGDWELKPATGSDAVMEIFR